MVTNLPILAYFAALSLMLIPFSLRQFVNCRFPHLLTLSFVSFLLFDMNRVLWFRWSCWDCVIPKPTPCPPGKLLTLLWKKVRLGTGLQWWDRSRIILWSHSELSHFLVFPFSHFLFSSLSYPPIFPLSLMPGVRRLKNRTVFQFQHAAGSLGSRSITCFAKPERVWLKGML